VYTPLVPKQTAKDVVKTTVDLPTPLWQAAKIRAVEERSDLRGVIMRALTAYLRTPLRKED
jgi:hypothetical protein